MWLTLLIKVSLHYRINAVHSVLNTHGNTHPFPLCVVLGWFATLAHGTDRHIQPNSKLHVMAHCGALKFVLPWSTPKIGAFILCSQSASKLRIRLIWRKQANVSKIQQSTAPLRNACPKVPFESHARTVLLSYAPVWCATVVLPLHFLHNFKFQYWKQCKVHKVHPGYPGCTTAKGAPRVTLRR